MSVTLGVVIPCYNEEEVIRETSVRMLALLARLTAAGTINASSTIYFVDDGSRDATWSIIEELAAQHDGIAGIKLSRNRGHQNALLAGLLSAEGFIGRSPSPERKGDVREMRRDRSIAAHERPVPAPVVVESFDDKSSSP